MSEITREEMLKAIEIDVSGGCSDCPRFLNCEDCILRKDRFGIDRYFPGRSCPLPDLPPEWDDHTEHAEYVAACFAFVEKLRGMK